jgi:FMN hydrolase / 5-amino-6-(5-phospho-D-ribitylamino)uracil phosphatase
VVTRAICFDLDNTLWDVWPVIQRAEQAMYGFLASRYPRVTAAHTIESLRSVRDRVAFKYPDKSHDYTFLRQQGLRELAGEFAYAEDMAQQAFDVFIAARNEVELYDDVLPALEQLGQRYRLFTASNGNADLARIGLAHRFERSVAARHVGALKPHPAVFCKVIEGTDLRIDEVVYVGDDPELDVEGARAAGMGAIWLNRTGAAWPLDIPPPAQSVCSLTELTRLMMG